MNFEEIFEEFLDNTIYKEKQVSNNGIHLTAGRIYSFSGGGEIDFGGDEFQESKIREIVPQKRNEEDKYGWWNLEKGYYLVEFNELLKDDSLGFIVVSNDRILKCASYISPIIPSKGKIEAILKVNDTGISVKENARIALLTILRGLG